MNGNRILFAFQNFKSWWGFDYVTLQPRGKSSASATPVSCKAVRLEIFPTKKSIHKETGDARPSPSSPTFPTNVMTRDTQGRLHDRDSNDAEVYAALWSAAPFPRLPNDAPSEMRKLTIDVDDPKRVYAIHRASRRHQFQILVER